MTDRLQKVNESLVRKTQVPLLREMLVGLGGDTSSSSMVDIMLVFEGCCLNSKPGIYLWWHRLDPSDKIAGDVKYVKTIYPGSPRPNKEWSLG